VRKNLSCALVVALALAACSPHPTSVQPAPVPSMASTPCHAVSATLRDLTGREADLTDAQARAFAADTAAVLIVGPPLGRMAGMNRADELAQARGQLIAARARAEQCGVAP
jgi:hypothetical protein